MAGSLTQRDRDWVTTSVSRHSCQALALPTQSLSARRPCLGTFTAEIHPADAEGPVDIRAHHENVSYRVVEVPDGVRRGVLDLLRELRLTFAALDFRVVPGRGWIFLEANPNGQGAFIPELRDSIAAAITDFLESSCR